MDNQQILKEKITKLIEEYNARQDDEGKRLVLDEHSSLCRCTTCWYRLGSKERNTARENECKEKGHDWKKSDDRGRRYDGSPYFYYHWRCNRCRKTVETTSEPRK